MPCLVPAVWPHAGLYLNSAPAGKLLLTRAHMDRFKGEGFTLQGAAKTSTFDPSAAFKAPKGAAAARYLSRRSGLGFRFLEPTSH